MMEQEPVSQRESDGGPLTQRGGSSASQRPGIGRNSDMPPRGLPFPEPLPPSRRPPDSILSDAPLSMRFSEPPPSDAPVSMSPASLNFARFAGDAGPGYRVRQGEDGVTAIFEGMLSGTAPLIRLSPVAFWVPAEGIHVPRNGLGVVCDVRFQAMGREVGPFEVHLVPIDGVPGQSIVGGRLQSLTLERGRELLEFIHDLVRAGGAEPAPSLCIARELIEDPDRIRNLMNALLSTGGLGLIRSIGAPIRIERVDESQGVTIYWKGPENLGEAPFVIDMAGYNSIHRITIRSYRYEGGKVVTPLPSSIERMRHRWYRRCVVRSPMTVGFRHPLWPELVVTGRKVRDISYGGLCFEVDLKTDLAFPGLDLREITIQCDGEEPVVMQGQVRFVSLGKDGEMSLCGVMASPVTTEDERRWMETVSRELHENTRSGVEWSESIWKLFENSGYFSLSGKTPEQFEPLKASFLSFGQRAASMPQLLCQAVWPSQRGVEASVSLLKAYHGSWLGHQLAKRAGRAPGSVDPRSVMRDIYVRAFEHPQADPDFRWIIGYVEARVPWMQKAHVGFAEQHASTGLTVSLPFRLMEISSAVPATSSMRRIQVSSASQTELIEFLAVVQQCRPAGYADSLDLRLEAFDLPNVKRLWKEAGFARERDVLVARIGGVPMAAALVESGEMGTNLFRLLDGVRVFPMQPGGDSLAFTALMEACRTWYRSQGKESFVLFKENEDLDTSPMDLNDLGDGFFWVLSAMLLPEFLEHIYELTAHRSKK